MARRAAKERPASVCVTRARASPKIAANGIATNAPTAKAKRAMPNSPSVRQSRALIVGSAAAQAANPVPIAKKMSDTASRAPGGRFGRRLRRAVCPGSERCCGRPSHPRGNGADLPASGRSR